MRQVKFKKFIPHQYQILTTSTGQCKQVTIDGTGCYEIDFNSLGNFHSWGLTMQETTEQIASYTIAIIEDEECLVHEVLPTNLKFIN